MSAAVKCAKCNDNGMLPGSHDLDCASCGVAVERAALEDWCSTTQQRGPSYSDCWAIFQHGKAAGAAESAWMDIATAPLDGTEIRLLCEGGEDVGYFSVPLNLDGYAESWRGTVGEWSTKLGNGKPLKWQGIAGAAQAVPEWWISVAERLPTDTGTRYQILAICAKKITDDPTSPYCGQGIIRVGQDWHIRMWPQNFTHWMPLPVAPKAP